MPVLVMGAGIVYLAIELARGFEWVTADWLIVAELGLVAITGTAHYPTSPQSAKIVSPRNPLSAEPSIGSAH